MVFSPQCTYPYLHIWKLAGNVEQKNPLRNPGNGNCEHMLHSEHCQGLKYSTISQNMPRFYAHLLPPGWYSTYI